MKKELIEKNYQILERNGMFKQTDIWIEEMSEIIKELCKLRRNWEEWQDYIPVVALRRIREEITDGQVALDQMKKAFDYCETMQELDYAYKVDRALNELEKEK
jgi:hypothetical protein